MARRLIGTATTNSSGIATVSYTGEGAGKLQLVAESGNLSSETYELYDCGFYDPAINGDGNHKTVATSTSGTGGWLNTNGANLTVTYSSNGTTLTNVDGTTRHFYYHDTSITSTKLGNYNTILNNMAIEFEVTAISSQIEVYLTDGTNNKSVPITETGNYKIVFDGSIVHLFKDNVEQTLTGTNTMNGTNIRVSFLTNATNESVTFRKFMAYPI